MFLDTTTEGDLLPDLCADRVGQDDLGQVSLHGADTPSGGQGPDVHHQNLVFGKLLDLWAGETVCWHKFIFLKHCMYADCHLK